MSNSQDAEYVDYVVARLPSLRRVAFLLCQDWHSADDLAQVTATKLFSHWSRVRHMEDIDGYARTILVRAFLGERRSAWRRHVSLPGFAPEHAAATPDRDAVLDVRSALAALPPRQRATLVLRFYCDLDVAQAATALNCSSGTVKSQTSKGLAALRRLLTEQPAYTEGAV
jgi:RNA polymerase sigma-70 factor (sigma-E family)